MKKKTCICGEHSAITQPGCPVCDPKGTAKPALFQVDKLLHKPKWSFEAIEALVARLYECRRKWQETGLRGEPVFVLPSRNTADRHDLVTCLFAYFETKYGIQKVTTGNLLEIQAQLPNVSFIHFPAPNVTLCLMDV